MDYPGSTRGDEGWRPSIWANSGSVPGQCTQVPMLHPPGPPGPSFTSWRGPRDARMFAQVQQPSAPVQAYAGQVQQPSAPVQAYRPYSQRPVAPYPPTGTGGMAPNTWQVNQDIGMVSQPPYPTAPGPAYIQPGPRIAMYPPGSSSLSAPPLPRTVPATGTDNHPRSFADTPALPAEPSSDPRSNWSSHDQSRGLPLAVSQLETALRSSGRTRQRAEKYDGTMDWADNLKQFEMVADWNGWSEEENAAQLSMSLTGTARQAWADSFSDPHTTMSYAALVKALSQRFKPVGHEEAYKAEFRRRSRGKEETFLEFGHGLRRLAIRAFPKINFEAREELVVDQFLLGLPDAEMRRHVSLAPSGNVDQAITLATEYETVSQSMKGIVPSKPKQVAVVKGTGTSSQDSSNTEDLLKVLIDLVKKQNRSGHGNRHGGPQRASPIICFKCSQPGHIARDCPPLQTEQTTPGEENQNGKKSPLN